MNASLRTKGILAVTVLIVYLAIIGVFLTHQQENLVLIVQEIETIQADQTLLAPLASTLAHSMVEIQDVLNSLESAHGGPVDYGDLPDQFAAIGAALEQAHQIHPSLAKDVGTFNLAAASMRAAPSQNHLAHLRDVEQQLIVKFDEIVSGLQTRSTELSHEYHDTQQNVSTFAVAANVVGAAASIAVIIIFFTRLAKDIRRLQDRAVAIVAGYAGEPLQNTRRDEVGGLIDSVNRMQVDLRRWEQQMEVARQQRSHVEKMAAVGSLAAAIGHEVSNPIAAIAGVAQFIVDETKRDDRPSSKSINEFAAQILSQTERIARIMRKLATATAPHPHEPELLDLNALIQSTCGFISYDPRLRGIAFKFDLGHDIPAVMAVADHVTQILMNLVINASDAMEVTDSERRTIRVATRSLADAVEVTVSDYGRGMTPGVVARAFDESFTTKPAGQGQGIGLFVCKTLMDEAGGQIEIESAPGAGTTVHLCFPTCPRQRAAA